MDLTHANKIVGSIIFSKLETWDDANRSNFFHGGDPGEPTYANYYRDRLPHEPSPPILILDKITIKDSLRGQGYGTSAILAFLSKYQSGFDIAFLHVGRESTSENYEDSKKWRIPWYESLGWQRMELHPTHREYGSPLMWHDLKNIPLDKARHIIELRPESAENRLRGDSLDWTRTKAPQAEQDVSD